MEGVNWGHVVTLFLFSVTLYAELAALAHMGSLALRGSNYMENDLHSWIVANGRWFRASLAGELFSLSVVL